MPLAYNIPERFSTNLIDSVDWSRRQQKYFLDKRLEILRQVLGKHYGKGGCAERVPQNFVRLYLSILSRFLVSRSPAPLLECRDPRYRSLVRQTKMWAKEYFAHVRLEGILQAWAYEALLFPCALLKVCKQEESHYGHAYAKDDMPGASVYNVDSERSVYDMAATEWDMIDYIGHRCTVDKASMYGEGWDEERVRTLTADPHTLQNERGGQKTESLSIDEVDWTRKLREYIDVWELYLPKENLLATYPVIGSTIDKRPIRVQEYVGPAGRDFPTGPFLKCTYEKTPGNLLGNPPVHIIYDLHLALNRMTRKLLRQAERQKDLTLVQSQYRDEGETIKKSNDGDVLPVSNKDAFASLRTGGPDQLTMNFSLHTKALADFFGGNLSLMGGLGSQSPTLGQDELLSAGASQQVQFYQAEFLSATRPVMKSLIWYKWNSNENLNYTEHVPNTGVQFPWAIEPESRRGLSFEQMHIDVHPYSMTPITPQKRLAQYKRLMNETLLPLMPALMQQGLTIDFSGYIRLITELEDLPNVDEFLALVPLPEELMQQMMQGQGGNPMDMMQGPRVRPEGTGQYVRRNVGMQNPDQALLQANSAAPSGNGEAA